MVNDGMISKRKNWSSDFTTPEVDNTVINVGGKST